uniref:Bridging integrator 3 n=1 Tax=Podarcis muralis TaxID=64176 RepID=A0A670JW60_PODMU
MRVRVKGAPPAARLRAAGGPGCRRGASGEGAAALPSRPPRDAPPRRARQAPPPSWLHPDPASRATSSRLAPTSLPEAGPWGEQAFPGEAPDQKGDHELVSGVCNLKRLQPEAFVTRGFRSRLGSLRNRLYPRQFSGVFPSLNMAVKRREQTLQDYKRLQSKVEKYEEKEKTGPILTKLHQAREELRPVKDEFEAKNKQLLEEMPKFYSSRINYFKPSFESLIRAQVVYYTEMYKIFGDLTEQIDEPGLTDEQRQKENEAKLNELRALSIVADD